MTTTEAWLRQKKHRASQVPLIPALGRQVDKSEFPVQLSEKRPTGQTLSLMPSLFLWCRLDSMVWPRHEGGPSSWLQPQERSCLCSQNLCMCLHPVPAS